MGSSGLGATSRAPFQERVTTNVTTANAQVGIADSQIPTEDTTQVIDSVENPETGGGDTPPENNGFNSLGLSPQILRAVAESGYTTPTPIQAQGIPHVMQRRDVIGIAQTGTGKTASFTLPMIELLARGRAKARMPRSLILEPTRELAAQVAENFEKYGKYNKLSMALLIGGVSFDEQDRKLDRGVDVLIATPGRLLDHVERGKLILSQVNILVIDEADRMLDMGFIPDVEHICKLIPFTRQTLFYSATMPPEIQRLTQQFLHQPIKIEVARPATTASNISQQIVQIPNNDWAKREALRRLIRENEATLTNAIIFCNRKRDVDVVAKSLTRHGFDASPIHGDLEQSLRTKTLDKFRAGDLKILVASDVAARGLDVPAVSHVFNFDVPIHADDYVHRVGRTGRAGRSGQAYMLASTRDEKYIEVIEKLTGKKLDRREMLDIEVRDERKPRRENERGRGRERDKKHRDRRPEGGKFHEHVAPMEPIREAPDAAAEVHSRPAAPTAPQSAAPANPAPQPPRDGRRARGRTAQKPAQPRNEPLATPAAVDRNDLPAFLFRPIPKLAKAED
jgi:superfamily II DNA/RNA helicase